MLVRFGERCAFSGVQPPQVLEAAHLYSFAKRRSIEGMVDSSCVATTTQLFDAKLVAVNPESLKIEIAPRLLTIRRTGVLTDLRFRLNRGNGHLLICWQITTTKRREYLQATNTCPTKRRVAASIPARAYPLAKGR